jgi:chromosome partitioning protein
MPDMAYIVCIIGNKGGTGKTTLTHLLAHGLGLLGQRAVAVLTEQEREPLTKTHRSYLPVDARVSEALTRVTSKLKAVEGWFGVVDGGGNRPEMDTKLAALADLILLPFRDSHEDIRTVRRDLERFAHAYAIPSQWPTNVWQLEAANRMIADQMADLGPRVLAPLSAVSASKLLLQIEAPETLPTPVNNVARMLAWRVIELLDAKLEGLGEASETTNQSRALAVAQAAAA